ncbi:branched-chain amino acid ABC transporter substrate-binding protein [Anaerolineales bacterium]
MSKSRLSLLLVGVLLLALALAACSTATPTPTQEPTAEVQAATDTPTEEAVVEATEEAVMEATEEVVMEATEEAVMEATEEVVMEATEEVVEMMGPSVMIAPDEPLRVGFAAAMVGEGLAPLGIDILRGVELALEDYNNVVVVDGVEFTVELDVQDSLCSPEGGQAVANRFASDPSIVGVIGPMCSSACDASQPIFDAAGYSNISASCTAANLTTNGNTSFNRTVPSDAAQGVIAAEFIYNELGVTKIAVLDDGSTYGAGLADLLIQRFEELGGEVVARDAVTVGDTDFRALLEDIASKGPELLYFGGFNSEAARLLEQRIDVGLEDIPFMGADGIYGPELAELAGAAAEGVYASAPRAASSDELDAFRARYVETYGEEPPSAFNTNSYDAANLLMMAVQAVGHVDDNGDLVVDRNELAAYIRSASFDGLTGSLACDGTGECSTADVAFYQITDGAYVELGADE